ncbi:MAG: hypothetical protein RMY62_013295 [Nostoc sp. ZfuVER08]|nr:hypothetical protein [Nostoc sp. ZfuVER08]
MKLQVGVIISTLFLINFGNVWGQQVVRVTSQKRLCEPIAKVISGDIRYQPLTKLCQEDKVNAANGRIVKIFCYARGTILEISSGSVGKHCSPLSNRERRGCTMLSGRNCINPKGPNEENAPSLITPYGVVIMNPHPILSWSTTSTATSYLVQVKGIGVNWEVVIEGNSLPYPQDKPAMKPGNVYAVNIIAMRGDEPLNASSSALLLLPTAKTQEVAKTINILTTLKQSPDESAIDMDAVYEAQNLVDNSIKVLNARVKAGSKNPTIYRLLGDRYLIANLAQPASKAYSRAKALAQRGNNALESAKAQAGIEIARQYIYPPTRIKPAQ